MCEEKGDEQTKQKEYWKAVSENIPHSLNKTYTAPNLNDLQVVDIQRDLYRECIIIKLSKTKDKDWTLTVAGEKWPSQLNTIHSGFLTRSEKSWKLEGNN